MSTLLAGASREIASNLGKRLVSGALGRARDARQEQFFETLVAAYGIDHIYGNPDRAIDEAIDALTSGDHGLELLWGAFRKVSLSTSKALGPRIIALLVAKIRSSEDRIATEEEERIFEAAGQLRDREFRWYANCWRKVHTEEGRILDSMSGARLTHEFILCQVDRHKPLPLAVSKLVQLGIVRLGEHDFTPTTRAVDVIADETKAEFAMLIDRATGPAEQELDQL